MKTPEQYEKWLNEVRVRLLSLNVLSFKNRKPYRRYLFSETLVLDRQSWFHFFENGFTPHQAVAEDMELPWIEYKKHVILN